MVDLTERMTQAARALRKLGVENETAAGDYSDELDQQYRLGRAASYYQAADLILSTLRDGEAI